MGSKSINLSVACQAAFIKTAAASFSKNQVLLK
jgi:hypothetical protein